MKSQKQIGAVLSYLTEVVKILTALVYTPIMLRILGDSEYGLYQLVYSTVSYLGLLSLGFGSSYIRFFSRSKAKNREDEIARLNGMFIIIFGIMATICAICGVIMVKNLNVIFGMGLTEAEYKIAKKLIIILVVNLTITFSNSVFNCIITAHEQFVFQKMLLLFQSLLNPFIALPLLMLGYGSVGIVSVTTFLTIAVFVSNVYYVFFKLRVKFLFSNLQIRLFKEMSSFTFFIFLNQIVDQINWNADKFLLGRILGTSAVAVYGVGGQINSLFLQFSRSISNIFIPQVNRIVAERNDNRELTDLFIKVGRIQFLILSLILSGFTFFGAEFISYWAGSAYYETYYIALLLMFPIMIPLIQNVGIEIQRAKNKHQVRTLVYLCIAVINIFISIPLIRIIGAIGAAVGTAITMTAGNVIFMNWYYHYKIGLNIPKYWRNILNLSKGLMIPIIFGIMINYFVTDKSIIFLCVKIICYSFAFVVSMWKYGMNIYEKKLILGFIKRFSNIRRV